MHATYKYNNWHIHKSCMQIATHLVEERDLLVDKEGVGNPD